MTYRQVVKASYLLGPSAFVCLSAFSREDHGHPPGHGAGYGDLCKGSPGKASGELRAGVEGAAALNPFSPFPRAST